MTYPRMLVFSNDGFSKSSSNGRTLANLLIGWPKECLAQFCLINADPDFDTCVNIFRVTDGQALRALWGRAGGGILQAVASAEAGPSRHSSEGRGSLPRNTLTMLLRDLVWGTGCWKRSGFVEWVSDFAPELILLQAGDTGFMLELAMETARKYGIPLAVYNSENYYFKDYDYFRDCGISAALYNMFHRRFQGKMRRLMAQGSCYLYTCEKLTRMYAAEFGREGFTAYTPASVICHGTVKTRAPFRVSYLGNLGIGRHLALIELAEVLREIDPKLHLDVYGSASEDIQVAFDACDAIQFHGRVPYETVLEVMAESNLLIHAEGKDPFTVKDLSCAFSTKIADCLGSGTPLLLYAPESIACSEYVRELDCAFYASNREDLKSQLLAAMDPTQAQAKLDRAYEVACENHDPEKTPRCVQTLLCGLVQ